MVNAGLHFAYHNQLRMFFVSKDKSNSYLAVILMNYLNPQF